MDSIQAAFSRFDSVRSPITSWNLVFEFAEFPYQSGFGFAWTSNPLKPFSEMLEEVTLEFQNRAVLDLQPQYKPDGDHLFKEFLLRAIQQIAPSLAGFANNYSDSCTLVVSVDSVGGKPLMRVQ
jgi:hypothetical protein